VHITWQQDKKRAHNMTILHHSLCSV